MIDDHGNEIKLVAAMPLAEFVARLKQDVLGNSGLPMKSMRVKARLLAKMIDSYRIGDTNVYRQVA